MDEDYPPFTFTLTLTTSIPEVDFAASRRPYAVNIYGRSVIVSENGIREISYSPRII